MCVGGGGGGGRSQRYFGQNPKGAGKCLQYGTPADPSNTIYLYTARVDLAGGGHSGTKWLPTAKRPRGAEAVNAKIWGWSTHLKANKGGGQLPTKNQIGVVTCKVCFFPLYFVNYMIFIT